MTSEPGSVKLIYKNVTRVLEPLSGTFRMQTAIPLSKRYKYGFRVISVEISNAFPNLYRSTLYNEYTNVLRITRDGGSTWQEIEYQPAYLNTFKINLGLGYAQKALGWCTSQTLTPISILADAGTQKMYILYRPEYLLGTPGTLGVDLGQWDPVHNKIAQVLGYNAGYQSFDGIAPTVNHEDDAPNTPRIDYQSGSIALNFGFFGSSYLSGVISSETIRIRAPEPSALNPEYTLRWPTPSDNLLIFPAYIPESFESVKIDFLDANTGRQIEFMPGATAYVMFDIIPLGLTNN